MHDWKLLKFFYVSLSQLCWLFSVMVMIPDWESVGCEFEYRDVCFFGKKGLL